MEQFPLSKKTLIASLCTLTLVGCLDDPYEEPNEPVDKIVLYGSGDTGAFSMAVVDSSDTKAFVDANGSVSQGNVHTRSVTGNTQSMTGNLNGDLDITITNDEKGRVLLQSKDGSPVLLDIDTSKATLQFNSKMKSRPIAGQEIYLTTQKSIDSDVGQVSLTSSFLASYNGATQTVKVPLSCFTTSGMDFTQAVTPFAIESSNNLDFTLGSIQIVANSADAEDVLECQSSSEKVEADDSNDSYQVSTLFNIDDSGTGGWATGITNWMTSGEPTLHWGSDHVRLEYTDAPLGENGGLVFATTDGSDRDISSYIETGMLQFMLKVSSYAAHPTKRLQVQMESSEFGNSKPYLLGENAAQNRWTEVKIPLSELFTRDDGSVNINVVKNIDKGLSILPEWVESTDTLQGIDFSVRDIRITMNDPTKEIVLYGPNDDQRFDVIVIDSDSVEAIVDENGNSTQGNIQTQNPLGTPRGTLNVTISGDNAGRILLRSSDSSHVNIDVDPSSATIQFDVSAISKPALDQEIYITTQNEVGVDKGKVSITSALLANYNQGTQTIKVPLSCFSNEGMDYTNTISPLALESSTNSNFEFGNARIIGSSNEQSNVLECDNTSTPLAGDDQNDSYAASKVFFVSGGVQGWATGITNWMTGGSSTLHWGGDHIRIDYDNAPIGENGGLVLKTVDDSTRDLSNYIDRGILQFMFNVDNYGSHPTQRFQIQMESSQFGNSQPYILDVGMGWQQIQVPLRDLFSKADGSIDINTLKNIETAVSILPEWVGATDTLQGMQFSIGSVQLVIL
ncbi:putative glycoside hydrolase [Vibrio barjaei]|uniref:putative glycoside hydrolase n=1 Tax=Vibrio barjaei TaxID=1676683 RepID=UPI002285276C|nr:putative glycoside hydrolase [Vibrio barjaei]MCY9874387.1 putative glycoside hydrolase [Vibrio barjaei]